MPSSKKIPIENVIRPVMQLRACCDRVSSAVLRNKMGFGSSQLRIMYVLANKPEITQKTIADFWDVTEASVSRQIGILVDRGLAVRKNKGDPGGQGAAITPKGKKALDTAMKEVGSAYEKIFKEMPDSDRKKTVELLEIMIEKIRGTAQFK